MAGKFTFQLKNIKKFNKKLNKIQQRMMGTVLEKHLFQEGEGIMAQSKEMVPVNVGTLRSSGHVQLPKRTVNQVSVTMGYGGPAAGYAVKVHEDMQAFHKVGGAKYLSLPFNQAIRGFAKRLAVRLKKEVK